MTRKRLSWSKLPFQRSGTESVAIHASSDRIAVSKLNLQLRSSTDDDRLWVEETIRDSGCSQLMQTDN
jgi:hypothetical protein